MACLNLTTGNFAEQQWKTDAHTNSGDVVVDRDANHIVVQKAGFASSLVLNGDFRYVVFGGQSCVALLGIQDLGGNSSQRTVFIVDITGASLTTAQILSINLPNSQALPHLASSPGNGSLAFIWSGTGNVNEVTTLSIVRSDDGSPVLTAFGPISNINGSISAEVTQNELVIHHPTQSGNDSTSCPRPAGSLTIVPGAQDFGEAVLGADLPGLDTVTRTFTFRNDGNDCLSIDAIANSAPYSLTAASAAQLPHVLDPGEQVNLDVVFAPTATGNFTRSLQVTRTPAAGAASFTCSGQARQAEARITTSVNAINFGTIPHPGTDTRTFNVTNSGEVNLAITINGAPPGSSFTWTTAAGQAMPAGGAAFVVTVTFTTPGDFAAAPQTITITPTQGTPRTVGLSGAGCVPNAEIQVPAIQPLDFAQIERGFRTVRIIEITNTGDSDLGFRARITPAADPAQAALFGLILPDSDITDAPGTRLYSVLPDHRCGPGPVGPNRIAVAVGFFADADPGVCAANLVIDQHNATNAPAGQSWTFPLTAEIINPVPIDAVLVFDRSGSMADPIGSRNKSEAALAAGRLFVQMLRDTADDRAALVRFNENPEEVQAMVPVQGNRPALVGGLTPGNFAPSGSTNIAGGIIVGEGEFTPNPANPPVLKKAMVVLTDGMENRCYQIGGVDPWYSITGRDGNDTPAMRRPDGTRQDTEPLPAPAGIKVYGIGLGQPEQIDAGALDALSTATGASYDGVVDLTGKDYFLLEKYFTQIFMDTAGLQQISDPFYTIQPGDDHTHEFDVFPGDVNAMVVLYDEPGKRLPFFVVSPKGEVLSGTSLPPGFAVRFHATETARLVDFYFPHGEPDRYAGRWKVIVRHEKRVCIGGIDEPRGDSERHEGGRGESARGRRRATMEKMPDVGPGFTPRKCREYDHPVNYGIAIGAGSNLRMQPYVEPGTKRVGEPIRLTAVLSEAGLPVKGSTVRVFVESPGGQEFTVPLLDDGHAPDGQADDGEYNGIFTGTFTAGVYKLRFRAEGTQAHRPYVREAHRTKTVLDKRRPGGDGGGGTDGGAGANCCRKLLRAIARQEELLRRLLKEDTREL